MDLKNTPRGGMRSFMVIWVGQMFSLLGTSMSGFGLTVWAYELTGKATALAWLTPDELRIRRSELFAPLRRCLDAGLLAEKPA